MINWSLRFGTVIFGFPIVDLVGIKLSRIGSNVGSGRVDGRPRSGRVDGQVRSGRLRSKVDLGRVEGRLRSSRVGSMVGSGRLFSKVDLILVDQWSIQAGSSANTNFNEWTICYKKIMIARTFTSSTITSWRNVFFNINWNEWNTMFFNILQ